MVEVEQVSDPRDVTRETAGEAKHLHLQTGQWHEQTHRPPDSATKLTQAMTLSLPQMPERLPSGDIEAIFSLCDSDYTYSMWQVGG